MDPTSLLDGLTNAYAKIEATQLQRKQLDAQVSAAQAESLAAASKKKTGTTSPVSDNTLLYVGAGIAALLGGVLLVKAIK